MWSRLRQWRQSSLRRDRSCPASTRNPPTMELQNPMTAVSMLPRPIASHFLCLPKRRLPLACSGHPAWPRGLPRGGDPGVGRTEGVLPAVRLLRDAVRTQPHPQRFQSRWRAAKQPAPLVRAEHIHRNLRRALRPEQVQDPGPRVAAGDDPYPVQPFVPARRLCPPDRHRPRSLDRVHVAGQRCEHAARDPVDPARLPALGARAGQPRPPKPAAPASGSSTSSTLAHSVRRSPVPYSPPANAASRSSHPPPRHPARRSPSKP